MASRGGIRAVGSDGSDFGHREKVAAHYQVSSTYKVRLKLTIILHFLLFFLVCAKVSVEVLEQFGIYVLELQDMDIPKPLIWEWIWLSSLIFAFLGFSGIRRNRVTTMKIYAWGTFLFALCPVVGAAIYYMEDLLKYLQSESDNNDLQKWKEIPIAAIWYVFIAIAFQVHMFSLYFAIKLLEAWVPKNLKKN